MTILRDRTLHVVLTIPLYTVACLSAAGQTTINLSRDLVRLGIAGQNLTPGKPKLDAQPLLTKAITYAQNNGVEELTADTGAYYFLTPQNDVLYIFLGEVSNLTIDFKDSHLYFKNGMIRAFEVDYCQHVTLKNFTVDALEPRHTQVRLMSVDPVNRVFTYSVPEGWPDPATFTNTVFGTPQLFAAFFRNGTQVPATSINFVRYPIKSAQFAVTSNGEPWTETDVLKTLKPGDMAAIWDRSGLEAISVYSGDFITLSNIEVHGSGGGFAVAVSNSSNSIADNVRVEPRSGDLISSNADGIHFSFSLRNNHIRRCYVTGTTDDALAMDSDFVASVISQPGPRQLVAQRNFFNRVSNGSMMNFVHLNDAVEVSGAVAVAQDPPDSQNVAEGGQIILTFDRDLPPLLPGDEIVFASPDMRGAGSTIEDNLVANIPVGRGVYLGGIEDVIVQRNVIRGTSNAGINISEVTVPAGGGGLPSHGVTIQDNSIQRVLGPQGSGAGGAIVNQAAIVVSSNDTNFDFATSPVNSNVRILSNFIAGSGRGGIWIGEVDAGIISDNVVTRWHRFPDLPVWGANPFPVDLSQPLAMQFSSDLTAAGNAFEAESHLTGAVILTQLEGSPAAEGSHGCIHVEVNVPNFAWLPISNVPWLVITDSNVQRNDGFVEYTTTPNETGSPRMGTIAVAGVTVTVRQESYKKDK